MTKFFIPAAESPEQGQSTYQSIKEHLGQQLGAVFSDRRVRSLQWVHEGETHEAEVGKITSATGDMVVAILHIPARNLYYVCTASRGVFGGGGDDGPYLVGGGSVRHSVDFDR